jgi:hypothetical protein
VSACAYHQFYEKPFLIVDANEIARKRALTRECVLKELRIEYRIEYSVSSLTNKISIKQKMPVLPSLPLMAMTQHEW